MFFGCSLMFMFSQQREVVRFEQHMAECWAWRCMSASTSNIWMFAQGVSAVRAPGAAMVIIATIKRLLLVLLRKSSLWMGEICLCLLSQTVSKAAGQGVTITGEKHRNSWDWANSVVFAATIVTTIGLYRSQNEHCVVISLYLFTHNQWWRSTQIFYL